MIPNRFQRLTIDLIEALEEFMPKSKDPMGRDLFYMNTPAVLKDQCTISLMLPKASGKSEFLNQYVRENDLILFPNDAMRVQYLKGNANTPGWKAPITCIAAQVMMLQVDVTKVKRIYVDSPFTNNAYQRDMIFQMIFQKFRRAMPIIMLDAVI